MKEEKSIPGLEDVPESGTSGSIQLIIFSVGDEEYGLEIEKVQEIIRMKTIKKLPRTSDFILGVMNLRGNIIPIIGLREKFNMPSKEFSTFTRIIVVNHRDKLIGMVVDEVNQVLNISAGDIEANPEMVNEDTNALVRGMAKSGERIFILVELDYLLYSLDEIEKDNR